MRYFFQASTSGLQKRDVPRRMGSLWILKWVRISTALCMVVGCDLLLRFSLGVGEDTAPAHIRDHNHDRHCESQGIVTERSNCSFRRDSSMAVSMHIGKKALAMPSLISFLTPCPGRESYFCAIFPGISIDFSVPKPYRRVHPRAMLQYERRRGGW